MSKLRSVSCASSFGRPSPFPAPRSASGCRNSNFGFVQFRRRRLAGCAWTGRCVRQAQLQNPRSLAATIADDGLLATAAAHKFSVRLHAGVASRKARLAADKRRRELLCDQVRINKWTKGASQVAAMREKQQQSGTSLFGAHSSPSFIIDHTDAQVQTAQGSRQMNNLGDQINAQAV